MSAAMSGYSGWIKITVKEMAEECGHSVSTARRSLAKFERMGVWELRRVRTGNEVSIYLRPGPFWDHPWDAIDPIASPNHGGKRKGAGRPRQGSGRS